MIEFTNTAPPPFRRSYGVLRAEVLTPDARARILARVRAGIVRYEAEQAERTVTLERIRVCEGAELCPTCQILPLDSVARRDCACMEVAE